MVLMASRERLALDELADLLMLNFMLLLSGGQRTAVMGMPLCCQRDSQMMLKALFQSLSFAIAVMQKKLQKKDKKTLII